MTKYILAFVLLVASAFGTTVTGTTKDPSTGNLFNGSISFSLNYNGARQISTNQVLISPRPAPTYPITNGVVPSGLVVVGNDDISPSKTIYLTAWFDLNGALIRVTPYSITGSTFDLGTAIPTPITTSNVSVLDLIGLRTLSTTGLAQFGSLSVTGASTFAGVITSTVSTGTAPIVAASTTPVLTLVVSKHPQISTCDGLAANSTCPAFSALPGVKEVNGSGTLSGGVSTVNGLPFSTTGYNCTVSENSSLNLIKVSKTSNSVITVTGTGTDNFSFHCAGI